MVVGIIPYAVNCFTKITVEQSATMRFQNKFYDQIEITLTQRERHYIPAHHQSRCLFLIPVFS